MTRPFTPPNTTSRCDSCWFEPRCIAQPKSAADVSKALRVVTFLGSKFAVRSGGHNPNPGFGGIDDHGLLIDLIKLDEVTLHADGSTVSIGPGNRAGRVYKVLEAEDKTIMGPRLNDVGIGGYMLGGGLTYFSSRYGWAADNIVNYEVRLRYTWYKCLCTESETDCVGQLVHCQRQCDAQLGSVVGSQGHRRKLRYQSPFSLNCYTCLTNCDQES